MVIGLSPDPRRWRRKVEISPPCSWSSRPLARKKSVKASVGPTSPSRRELFLLCFLARRGVKRWKWGRWWEKKRRQLWWSTAAHFLWELTHHHHHSPLLLFSPYLFLALKSSPSRLLGPPTTGFLMMGLLLLLRLAILKWTLASSLLSRPWAPLAPPESMPPLSAPFRDSSHLLLSTKRYFKQFGWKLNLNKELNEITSLEKFCFCCSETGHNHFYLGLDDNSCRYKLHS